ADGLAFSTQRPNYIPASLNNIFLEFSRDLNCSQPLNGNLLPWVKEGTPAQQIAKKCQINENRKVVGVHPSPRSADRGFFGTRPFSKTNQLLSESGKEPVN
ncbi:9529_t:CDS:2, partial [Racocetra persica]